MEIAGLTGQVESLFESTRDYCRKYLAEGEPNFTVAVSREDLAFEQEALRQEALEEGIKVRVFTDPFLERTAIQRKFAEYLFDRDVLMTHGSTVAVDGNAFLFTAKCGTGKSTHTRLWREVLGDRAVMVNDDKPFLEIKADRVWLYGSPWSGKHGLDANICVPLNGICILERGKENAIHPATAEEAFAMLQKQAYEPLNTASGTAFLTLVETLSQKVPLWKLACNKEPQAATVAWEAMGK